MRQLSGLDNLFLDMEDNQQHMHVAALGIYDPASAPGGHVRFKTVLDFFANKINELPFFRRRLVHPPLGMDRPYWIDDPNVDVEYHVHHTALPHPGDWRQLMIQVARLHSRPMDMARPVWEADIIGGLDNIDGIAKGSFALYIKMHHCGVDGQAGSELLGMLHSLTPKYDTSPKTTIIYADQEPGALDLSVRSVINRNKQVFEASRLALKMGKKTLGLGAKYGPTLLQEVQGSLMEYVGLQEQEDKKSTKRAPTRFDGKVSPHRVVDALGIPMDDLKTIRQHVDATINDIFLAASGGALRKYLAKHDDLPEVGLSAIMPMAASGKDRNLNSGNNIGMTLVSVYSDIEDPIERLSAVQAGTAKNKELQEELGRDFVAKLLDIVPSSVAKQAINATMMKNGSLTVSNVRGPDIPLYIAGAKMQMTMPVSIPFHGVGLNITGFSYNGTLWVCITACREMMPDPAFFTECFREAVAEMVAAAVRLKGT